jgi:2-iminobutanoate/2-iminopropanoate deaminase
LKTAIQVDGAPKAIGPYSQGQVVRLHGGQKMLFSAGQIGLDPATMEVVTGGITPETERVFANLAAVLAGAALSFDDVVKTTVYLADMADFQAMNAVYAKYFTGALPARTTIAASGLPRNVRVEIDVVAIGRDQ